jgi:hypothetical protein
MFQFTQDVPRASKYLLFHVPAATFPGEDARNIQMAAHCGREGYSYYGQNSCMSSATLVKQYYPDAIVPVLNYPSWWVRAYALFNDDSESFFMTCWTLNMVLLTVGILIYCYRYDYISLPLILFSPVTLLAIERGNNDAMVFFFLFVPLLVFAPARQIQSFLIGLAAALKIFPLFGYLAFVSRKPPFMTRTALLGAIFALPLVVISFLELPYIIDGTNQGFATAYGLSSLTLAPFFKENAGRADVAMAGFVLFWLAALVGLSRIKPITLWTAFDIDQLKPIDLTAFIISSSIYLFTFITFTNWAYRLIFLIPAFVILSGARSPLSWLVRLNILVIMWSPFAPYGWYIENIACFPLAILLSYFLIMAVGRRLGCA